MLDIRIDEWIANIWEFEKHGSRVTVSVRGPLILSDRDMAVRAARNCIGIALWVEHRLRPLIEAAELVPMLEDWSPGYPGFHAYYYRDQHMSPVTWAFLDMLRKSSGAGLSRRAQQRPGGRAPADLQGNAPISESDPADTIKTIATHPSRPR